ncbi:MAG: hypothetical protein HFE86_06665 [Clostridiales bacterium]|nr:hypothetical protein [Clostridiales bacterium]
MEALTRAGLRYVLAAAELCQGSARPARCIDIAARLGVARASACRMLARLAGAGLLEPDIRRGVVFTEWGRRLADQYLTGYRRLTALFQEGLDLSEYDAGECAMGTLSSLSPALTVRVCRRLEETGLSLQRKDAPGTVRSGGKG